MSSACTSFNRLRRLTTVFLLFGLAHAGLSQSLPNDWEHASWMVFNPNEDTLRNAWSGGLTAPQWSPIDADLDGDDDLFAFDRDGRRLLMFERTEDASAPWRLRWDWTEAWPELVDWCLLRDYNCDGKPDIFTSHQKLTRRLRPFCYTPCEKSRLILR